MGPLAHPRFDFAVRCTGPLVLPMAFTSLQLWWRMDALKKARQSEFRRAWADVQASAHPPPPVHGAKAQLVLRDNLWHRNDIERAYLAAIAGAREEVVLANAYFVPGGRLRRALLRAARRGVRVRVLLQGKYEGFMQYHAARPVYKQLLDGGVELREYMASALHAKVAVVDCRWATVGSSNLDPLSLLLAREANVVSTDAAFAADLHRHLAHAWEHQADPLDHAALRQRPWRQRFLDRVAFGLMRAVLFVSGNRY
jgi:cardiolipin synthase